MISNRIDINENAWIGANAVILPGVTIGKVVVAASSVISKCLDDYSSVGGVPAKVIRRLDRVENDA